MEKPRRHPTRRSHPELEDALESFVFTVTYKEHVKGSVVGDTQRCAAARALSSQPGIKNAWVTRLRTFIEFDDGMLLKYRNPTNVERAVDNYDGTAGLFPPGTYVLTPVNAANRIGARASRPRSEPGREKSKRPRKSALR